MLSTKKLSNKKQGAESETLLSLHHRIPAGKATPPMGKSLHATPFSASSESKREHNGKGIFVIRHNERTAADGAPVLRHKRFKIIHGTIPKGLVKPIHRTVSIPFKFGICH